jgi:hypothetical protein
MNKNPSPDGSGILLCWIPGQKIEWTAGSRLLRLNGIIGNKKAPFFNEAFFIHWK